MFLKCNNEPNYYLDINSIIELNENIFVIHISVREM